MRSVAVSPPWELCASSTMTAQRRVGRTPVPCSPPLLGHLQELTRHERELLQGGDDDRYGRLQGVGELLGALLNLLHHPELVLELVDRVLELLVEHHAVGHDDHAVEDPLVPVVVQRGQPVGKPADAVALAAARRVLDQVVLSDAVCPGRLHQRAHGVELMEARKDHGLDLDLAAPVVALLPDLQVDEASEQIKQAVAFEHLLPEIARSVAASSRIDRVAGRAVAALVEGQEIGGVAAEPGGHAHALGVDGEVNEGAPLELEDGLPGIAVAPVLAHGVLHRLPGQRILEFQGGDG